MKKLFPIAGIAALIAVMGRQITTHRKKTDTY